MKKFNTFETCYFGMESIFNNAPNPKLIDKKVIKDLKDKSFNIENLHLVKVLDSYNCDVFSRDSKGVRRYQVSLDKNSHFDHLFKIININETKVTSRYQL